jgi:Formyl transferase
LKGYRVTLYGFPFVRRQQTPESAGFRDRPDQILEFDVATMARHYGFGYVAVGGWSTLDSVTLDSQPGKPDVLVTCIGKIIPRAFLAGRTVLNAHPGLLPQNRGVDAFKWSVVNGWPIGVTLHVIDEHIDAGWIVRRQRVPVYPPDTLRAVADRAYALECDLLAEFALWLAEAGKKWPVDTAGNDLSRRRISAEDDEHLEEIFLRRREQLVSLAADPSEQSHPSDELERSA